MYIEEPKRKINWGSVIKKGLVIILVAAIIFLIIWLFARNNSNAVNVDYENNTNNNVNEVLPNQNSYSETFINNFKYFHDTAKEYFLISELPASGKTIKYTLQEFIDKDLILPFSNGATSCNYEQSNAVVKNVNGTYTMIITLVCGDEIGQTTEELGCNQLCTNNSCIEKLEYQYKQKYETTETTYSCPKGYTKTGSGSNTKCVKSNSSTIDATKKVTYSCTEGKLDGTKCIISGTKTVDATAKTTYSCANGKLDGNKCVITNTKYVDAKANITISCPSGYNKNGNQCIKYLYTPISYGLEYKGCTGGQHVISPCSSGNCTTSSYVYKCTQGVNSIASYSCEDGSKPNSNNQCPVTSSYTVNATKATTYSCANGKLDGTKCVLNANNTINAVKTTNYTCPTGYTKYGIASESVCTKGSTTTVEATKSTKKVTKYKYKWSSETSLEGWTRTGETRKVSSK